jgi:hypothetical protein
MNGACASERFTVILPTNRLQTLGGVMGATDPASVSYMDLYVAIFTAGAGFVGSWIGAKLALGGFKQQRAFDKQLDWYERTDKAMHDLIQAIEIAGTFQKEHGTPADRLNRAWISVQRAHLRLGLVAEQGPLFGSRAAADQVARVDKLVQDAANESEAFDPPKIKARGKQEVLKLVYDLPEKLRRARKPLTAEARRHLGLDSRSLFQRVFGRQ